jgi:hypothetical protein
LLHLSLIKFILEIFYTIMKNPTIYFPGFWDLSPNHCNMRMLMRLLLQGIKNTFLAIARLSETERLLIEAGVPKTF